MNKDFRLEKRFLILDPSNIIEKGEIEIRKGNTYYNKIVSHSKNIDIEHGNSNIVPMHIHHVQKPIQQPIKPLQRPILKIMPNGMMTNNKKLKMVII
jgi:hypothetical protein